MSAAAGLSSHAARVDTIAACSSFSCRPRLAIARHGRLPRRAAARLRRQSHRRTEPLAKQGGRQGGDDHLHVREENATHAATTWASAGAAGQRPTRATRRDAHVAQRTEERRESDGDAQSVADYCDWGPHGSPMRILYGRVTRFELPIQPFLPPE